MRTTLRAWDVEFLILSLSKDKEFAPGRQLFTPFGR